MISSLFPLGITPYIIGGIFIGLGVSLIFIFTGIRAGASSFFSSTLSYFSKKEYFQRKLYTNARVWRIVFTLGLILGAFIFTFTFNGGQFFTTNVQWWRLALGGFLVGFGTRFSRGCTSGHGICGLASLSLSSFLAVITFLVVAIFTAFIVSGLGVIP
jgi:uncharacterized protein